MRGCAWWLAAVVASAGMPVISRAQASQRAQGEIRADAFVARDIALHGGVGITTPAGRNVRISLVAAAGRTFREHDSRVSARAEVTARFLLDPDFAARWGVYGAGGVGARFERRDSSRGLLVLILGVEGQRKGAFVPFAEAGYGGGLRLSLGVRQALEGRR